MLTVSGILFMMEVERRFGPRDAESVSRKDEPRSVKPAPRLGRTHLIHRISNWIRPQPSCDCS